MTIINSWEIHSLHSTISESAKEIIKDATSGSIGLQLSVPLRCVALRIMGMTAGVFWCFIVGIGVIPRMIDLSIKQINTYQGSIADFPEQFLKVQVLFLRIVIIDTAYFIGDILAPELMYGYCDLLKMNLEFHLDFMIQKITPLPGVFPKVVKQNPHIRDVTSFAVSLGVRDCEWRNRLKELLLSKYKPNGSDFSMLQPSSFNFRNAYVKAIYGTIIDKMRKKITQDTFARDLGSLTSEGFIALHQHLPFELIQAIFEARPDIESDIEQRQMMIIPGGNYLYRSTITRKFSEILFEYMKKTRDELLSRNIIIPIDVVSGSERVHTLIGCVAFMNMLDNGEELSDGILKLSSLDEPCDVILSHEKQIYGSKDTLLEIHKKLKECTHEEKQEVFMMLCDQMQEGTSDKVNALVQKIMEFKNITFDAFLRESEGYDPSDFIPWTDLETVSLD